MMKTGIYYDISFEDYKGIDAVNSSSLKNMVVSAKNYKHKLDQKKSTKAMAIGSAAHAAILEPEKFECDYVVYTGTRRGKAWEEFKSDNSSKEIITNSEYNNVISMRDSVESHAVSVSRLEGGTPEVTIIFVEPTTGILCKARVDYLDNAYRFFTDVKTTRDVEPHFFSRQSAQLMYHFQYGFYRLALHSITGVWIPAKCVAVQNATPFDTVCYNISTQAMDKGIGMVVECLTMLKECIETDSWFGVSEEEIDLELPAWAADAEEEELVIGDKKVMV